MTCEIVKVGSYQRMAELGIVATPAIAIDGGVVLAGRVPRAEEVGQLLSVA